MSSDLNSVMLIGRLTRDGELKYSQGGMAILKFSLAVGRNVKKNDRWEEETSFFDCTMFGKSAESMTQYLVKGKQISILGELVQDRWEKDGQKQSRVGIVVNRLQLLGGGGASPSGGASSGQAGQGAPVAPPADIPNDDSIPF